VKAHLLSLALVNSDYESIFFNQTFTSGSMDDSTRCTNISIVDDGALEDDEIFTVALITSDPDVMLRNMTLITIIDNDGTTTVCTIRLI